MNTKIKLDILPFCPRCGHKNTIKQAGLSLLICQNCQLEWYQNPNPSVNVLFFNQHNQVLLAKRTFNPKKDKWSIVGGFLESGENFTATAQREVKEEINLKINPKKLTFLDSTADRYQYQNWNYFTISCVFEYFLSDDDFNKIKVNDDVSEVKFFSYEDLVFEDLAFSGTKQAVITFFKKRAKGLTELTEMRNEIDQIDQKILHLLAKRKQVVTNIGLYKQSKNKQTLDQNREKNLIQNLENQAKSLQLPKEHIKAIWQQIIQDSVNWQKELVQE